MTFKAQRTTGRGGVCVLAGIVALVLAAPAHAQEPPPSSVDQYAELVPGAGGPESPATVKETRATLPRAAAEALDRAAPATAVALEEIVTSSSYGAPTSPRPRKVTPPRKPMPESTPPRKPVLESTPPRKPMPESTPSRKPVPESTPVETTLGSTLEAFSSTKDGQLVGTLIALLLVTVGAVTLAVLRARSL